MEDALPAWLAKILYKKLTGPFLQYATDTERVTHKGLLNSKGALSGTLRGLC